MRAGVWVLVAIAALTAAPGCSGGYPLAPTPCDDWCHATKGESCPEYYNPASCVSNCEAQNKDDERCRKELDAAIACFHAKPEAIQARCSGNYDFETLACISETQSLEACLSTHVGDVDR